MAHYPTATPVNGIFVVAGKELPIDEGFTYDGTQLLYNEFPRYSASKIHKMFFVPKDLAPEYRNQWIIEGRGALGRDLLIAQLKHYGLDFEPDATYNDLYQRLRDAVLHKKCREVPMKIRLFEAVLRWREIEATTLRGLRISLSLECRQR